MAEIRSTMDMVMERAAKMAAESKSENKNDDALKTGMKLAASFLQNGQGSLLEQLQERPAAEQSEVLQGMAETLLRNIVLPRDEFLLEGSMKSLEAVASLVGGEVASICGELQQLLNQYNQHKEQMIQQLDDAIRSQLQQKMMQQGATMSDDVTINPAMHPQYNEELTKMITDLNGQYNEALDQRKDMIRQRLTPQNG